MGEKSKWQTEELWGQLCVTGFQGIFLKLPCTLHEQFFNSDSKVNDRFVTLTNSMITHIFALERLSAACIE
jgi:hypothetical protein